MLVVLGAKRFRFAFLLILLLASTANVRAAENVCATDGSGATVVLLDDAGKTHTSEQFARWLGTARDRGAREIAFLCGAADGFPDAIAKRATTRRSLSPLTFSHELARAMLAEQLYRAFATLAGHPYPK
jgi:23S rRNA (pseudouridine1915-N3)-methyltransferase